MEAVIKTLLQLHTDGKIMQMKETHRASYLVTKVLLCTFACKFQACCRNFEQFAFREVKFSLALSITLAAQLLWRADVNSESALKRWVYTACTCSRSGLSERRSSSNDVFNEPPQRVTWKYIGEHSHRVWKVLNYRSNIRLERIHVEVFLRVSWIYKQISRNFLDRVVLCSSLVG